MIAALLSIIGFIRREPYLALSAVCLIVGIGLSVITNSRYEQMRRDRDDAQNAYRVLQTETDAAIALAQRNAAAIERRQAAEMAALADALNEEFQDANKTHAAVVAGLRADTVRLRREWQGCQADASLPGTASTTGSVDDAAELRAAGAADIVRLAAECDARIRAWQRYAVTVQRDSHGD